MATHQHVKQQATFEEARDLALCAEQERRRYCIGWSYNGDPPEDGALPRAANIRGVFLFTEVWTDLGGADAGEG